MSFLLLLVGHGAVLLRDSCWSIPQSFSEGIFSRRQKPGKGPGRGGRKLWVRRGSGCPTSSARACSARNADGLQSWGAHPTPAGGLGGASALCSDLGLPLLSVHPPVHPSVRPSVPLAALSLWWGAAGATPRGPAGCPRAPSSHPDPQDGGC